MFPKAQWCRWFDCYLILTKSRLFTSFTQRSMHTNFVAVIVFGDCLFHFVFLLESWKLKSNKHAGNTHTKWELKIWITVWKWRVNSIHTHWHNLITARSQFGPDSIGLICIIIVILYRLLKYNIMATIKREFAKK